MAYNKNDWKTGDVVTSTKLNNIEDGISNASKGMMYRINAVADGDNGELISIDKTVEEVAESIKDGYIPFVVLEMQYEQNGGSPYYILDLINWGYDADEDVLGSMQFHDRFFGYALFQNQISGDTWEFESGGK